jgi:hypothetical protein
MRRLTCLALLVAAGCDGGAAPQLHISAAAPAYGPLVGGTRITLTGTGFAADAAGPNRVLVAGREAPLAAAVDDSTLDVVIPPGEQPGDAEIVVLNRHGNAWATGIFRYSTPPTITGVAPASVVFSSGSTVVTVTGTGFADEGGGDVTVVVDGQVATGIEVTSDSSLTFVAPPGQALVSPDLELVNGRGRATRPRAFRYTPSARGGLLLFPPFTAAFAVFFDPVDNSAVTIPWVGSPAIRFTAVVLDDNGDYWGVDRSLRFGRLDMRAQRLDSPIQTQGWFPSMTRVGGKYVAIERGSRRFGAFDPVTGSFTPIGAATLSCCGSYGLASDGTTLYFTAREGAAVTITPIEPTTGEAGAPVAITAALGFHVEDMRFFAGRLYAASRDGTLVEIDPTTGATTVVPVGLLGRFNAMEVFVPR